MSSSFVPSTEAKHPDEPSVAVTDAYREKVREAYVRMAEVMARLRAPDGCPWDREQTMQTLKPYLIEETYEVLEAIEANSSEGHREELGDLLMQIVFQAEIAREEGRWDFADVAHAICDKLVRRHPHVFADVKVKDASEVLANWEKLKKAEKAGRGALSGVPRALPGLIRATRVGEKAGHAGFDFRTAEQAMGKLKEELQELDQAQDKAQQTAELGDVLFALTNVARKLSIDPEEALRQAVDKFSRRFSSVEAAAQGKLLGMSDEQKEALWQQAKVEEAKGSSASS